MGWCSKIRVSYLAGLGFSGRACTCKSVQCAVQAAGGPGGVSDGDHIPVIGLSLIAAAGPVVSRKSKSIDGERGDEWLMAHQGPMGRRV